MSDTSFQEDPVLGLHLDDLEDDMHRHATMPANMQSDIRMGMEINEWSNKVRNIVFDANRIPSVQAQKMAALFGRVADHVRTKYESNNEELIGIRSSIEKIIRDHAETILKMI